MYNKGDILYLKDSNFKYKITNKITNNNLTSYILQKVKETEKLGRTLWLHEHHVKNSFDTVKQQRKRKIKTLK